MFFPGAESLPLPNRTDGIRSCALGPGRALQAEEMGWTKL